MSIIMKNARQKLLGLLDFPTDEFKSSRQLSHVPLFYAQTNHFLRKRFVSRLPQNPKLNFYILFFSERDSSAIMFSDLVSPAHLKPAGLYALHRSLTN